MVNFISYCSRLFAACVLLVLSFNTYAFVHATSNTSFTNNLYEVSLSGEFSSCAAIWETSPYVDTPLLYGVTYYQLDPSKARLNTSYNRCYVTVNQSPYEDMSYIQKTFEVYMVVSFTDDCSTGTCTAVCEDEEGCQEYAANDCGDDSVTDWSFTDVSTFSYTCSADDSGDSDEECTIDNNYCDEADDDGSVDAGDSSDDSTDTGDDSGSCSTEAGCYALAQSACSPSDVATYTWTSGSEYSFTCAADDSDDSTDTGDGSDDSTDTGDDTDSGDSSDSGDDSDSSSGSSGSASGSYSSDGSDNGTSATSLTANGCTSFTCSDSAAACYIAKIQWVKSCENEGLYDEGGAATKLANTLSDYNNNTDSSELFTTIDVNDYTGKYTDGSGFTASSDAACPANQTLDTPLGTFEIDFGFICDGLAILKWFVICLATYQSVVVIARAF